MDLFKKGTLKSQSLNSRFLASNNNSNPSVTPRSLPVQVSKPKPTTTAQSATSGPTSKLKLTTTRQSSALKLTRENSSSQGANDAAQPISRDVALDRKAPVWNKGMPAQKSAKDYTDEELKAMHGISLVARNSAAQGGTKEGRWDDSDEDDAWNDTIDFGDGTKVTIGQAVVPDTKANDPVPTKAIPPRPADFTPAHASPFGNALGSPWKRSEFLAPRVIAQPVASHPVVSTTPDSQKPSNELNGYTSEVQEAHPIAAAPPTAWDRREAAKATPVLQDNQLEARQETRPRAESVNRDTRMQQPGDARYQYEQNTYDRHWQNPQPATREIYNSATGRLEQIDASQKVGRRMSHHDKRPTEVLHRGAPSTSGDARASPGQPPALVERRNSRPLLSPSATKSPTLVSDAAKPAQEPEAIPGKPEVSSTSAQAQLDPSSKEFIEMQKKLMSERREQAIQRRKEQEAEETARKDRARKKAEELAALAEKEKAIAIDSKSAEQSTKPKNIPKILSRPAAATAIENNLSTQRATSEAMQANSGKNKPIAKKPTNTIDSRPWQDRNQESSSLSTSARRGSFNGATSSLHDQPITFVEKNKANNDTLSPSHNVWGAIGSKKSTNESENTNARLNGSYPSSPATKTTNAVDRATAPSWSAFDGITQSRKALNLSTGEPREYNVFDASDEIISPEKPEKHKNSPSSQAQSRTSSRFFPSAASAEQNKSTKQTSLVVSPNIPPRLDSQENPQFASPDTMPSISLPPGGGVVSRLKGAFNRSIDQVMSNFGDSVASKDSKPSKYSKGGWLDTQTRSVWEIKPLRDGLKPRIKVPYSEKQLDWSRKEKPLPEVKQATPEVSKFATSAASTAIPAQPAWSMPLALDTTTRDSNIKEPLIPPQPSLKLPVSADDTTILERPLKRQQTHKFEHDRASKFYTTRPALVEEPDHNSPIRIKTVDAETQIPRKFGKRIDPAHTPQKRQQDVKRQPVNMSDAPGGSGFKRGFVNRVRAQPAKEAANTTAPIETKADGKSSPAPSLTPSSILRRDSPSGSSGTPTGFAPVSPQVTAQMHYSRSPNHVARGSPIPHFAHRESPMAQKYMPMQPVPPMHAQLNSPLVSRIAPPGLAAPAAAMTREDSGHGGHGMSSASIPPPTPRGPPGIV